MFGAASHDDDCPSFAFNSLAVGMTAFYTGFGVTVKRIILVPLLQGDASTKGDLERKQGEIAWLISFALRNAKRHTKNWA